MISDGEVASDVRAAASARSRELRRRRRRQVTLAALLATIAVLLAGALAADGVRAQIDARLRAAGAGANSGLVSVESEQLSLLRAITFTTGVSAALSAHSSRQLDRLVTPLQVNSGVPMVDVVLPDGTVVLAVRSKGAPSPVATRRGLQALRRSLAGAHGNRGGRFTEVVTLQGAPTLLTIGPVVVGHKPVGAVLVMTPLADVLARLATEVGAVLTSYSPEGLPLATTARGTPPPLVPITASQLFNNGKVIIRETPGDTREAVGRLMVDHEAETLLGVAEPDDSLVTELLVDLCGLIGLVLAAALLAGALLLKARRQAGEDDGASE